MKTYFDIEIDGLTLRTTVPVHSIQYLEIDMQENEHGRGIVRARIKEEYCKEILHACFGGDEIMVLGRKNQQLFSGLIEKIEFFIDKTFVRTNICFIDNTYLMDIEKKKRSFQDPEQNYAQIISKVLNGYDHADFTWQTDADRAINIPVIQYEETDWQFMKRLATHFKTAIYPEHASNAIMLYIGNKHGENRGSIQSENSISFHCGICDRFYIEGGYHYVLGQAGFIFREKAVNDKLAGISIKGKVERVQEQDVFIQLEIDQEKNAQYPWKWMPETGNLCYCMPEKGTDVMLYFASGQEYSGLAIHSFHENKESDIFSNIQNREIHTQHDKKMAIYPNQLFAEGKEKGSGIYVEDRQGIRLKSNKGISLHAGEGIYINGEKTDIFAPFEIVLRTDKSNIEINRDFNFYAPEGVQTNGTPGGTDDLPIVKPQEKKADHWQLAYSAMAAIPTVDFAKADNDGVVDLMVNAAIPKIAEGRPVFAMSDVMNGKSEAEARFAGALRSMDLYTVKGGYPLPTKEGNTQ